MVVNKHTQHTRTRLGIFGGEQRLEVFFLSFLYPELFPLRGNGKDYARASVEPAPESGFWSPRCGIVVTFRQY